MKSGMHSKRREWQGEVEVASARSEAAAGERR
jgi:hypothetical protein